MEWKQRDPSRNTVTDVVTALSGQSEEELLHPHTVSPNTIQNLADAVEIIRVAATNETAVSIMGDYDVDGITSSAILYYTLLKLGVKAPYVRLPRRMTEGYGLNEKVIDEFADGLLITVDNGIAAVDAIKKAKERGMTVVVLDHHVPPEILPNADIIVDPHVAPEKNGFVEYCGAGLAYKLAQMLFPADEAFLKKMEVLAAIGTIADSMPLIGDNRFIVKNGLASLASGKNLTPGLKALIRVAEVYDINEYDIGFKIGPMLNAAGRLRDDGAFLSFQTLTAPSEAKGEELAAELKEINEMRKDITTSTESLIEGIIQDECLAYDLPMCIYAEGVPEGIVGILTGRIAERYKVPTFIFTNTETPGLWKGSGRSYGDFDLMKVVNAAMPYLVTGGGHAGAAGVSVMEENWLDMVNAMREAASDYTPPDTDETLYDIRINAGQVFEMYKDVKKYAPYGQGNPRPVFLIEDVVLSPRAGSMAKYMGKSSEHVKLHAKNFSAICFGRSEDYRRLGCPANLDLLGELSMNVFRYSSELQVETLDFHEHKNSAAGKKPTSLMEALRRNGTI